MVLQDADSGRSGCEWGDRREETETWEEEPLKARGSVNWLSLEW